MSFFFFFFFAFTVTKTLHNLFENCLTIFEPCSNIAVDGHTAYWRLSAAGGVFLIDQSLLLHTPLQL